MSRALLSGTSLLTDTITRREASNTHRFHREMPLCIGCGVAGKHTGILRRLARSLDGRFFPVDARKLDVLCTRIARVTFVIYAAAAVEITSTMQLQQPSYMRLLALAAAAAVRHTTALSAPNLRPRTVQLDTNWHTTIYERDDIATKVAMSSRS